MAFSQNIARLRSLLKNFQVDEVKLLKGMSYQRATLSVGSNKTLDPLESGRLVFLESSSGAFSLTLPAVAAGLHYRCMVTEDTPTGAITIAAGSATSDPRLACGSHEQDRSFAGAFRLINVKPLHSLCPVTCGASWFSLPLLGLCARESDSCIIGLSCRL